MPYYFSIILDTSFDDAIARTIAALKEEGFGILTTIDVSKTLKERIGADFRPYTILGACNPNLAHEALKLEDKVGTMLPCNVVVQQAESGIEVAAVDPVASMQSIGNPQLAEKAHIVGEKLQAVIASLGAGERN